MKNEKNFVCFLITKIWQILKLFFRALSWAQTSYFWRVSSYRLLIFSSRTPTTFKYSEEDLPPPSNRSGHMRVGPPNRQGLDNRQDYPGIIPNPAAIIPSPVGIRHVSDQSASSTVLQVQQQTEKLSEKLLTTPGSPMETIRRRFPTGAHTVSWNFQKSTIFRE